MIKHIFAFKMPIISPTKPLSINLPKFKRIEKPKEVIKKTKPLNKNYEILAFLSKNNNNKYNNSFVNAQDIYNLDNINTPTLTPLNPLLEILIADSQTIVLDSVPFSHFSSLINNPSSIHSSIVDSNTFTQASNISDIYTI
jgi:hypothetical protein